MATTDAAPLVWEREFLTAEDFALKSTHVNGFWAAQSPN
jgi:hypothetical protein